MSGRRLFLFSAVLGVSLVLSSAVSAGQANLIGWWKFDETGGETAYDSSGNSNNGTIVGAVRSGGKFGGGLSFDGEQDYVSPPADMLSGIEDGITISFWKRDDGRARCTMFKSGNLGIYFSRDVEWGDRMGEELSKSKGTDEPAWEWNHWVFIKNVRTGWMKIYLNGVLWDSGSGMTEAMVLEDGAKIGSQPDGSDCYAGQLDDFRIYEGELSQSQLDALRAYGTGKAINPEPRNGARFVEPDVVLSWTAGDWGAKHDVYLGKDFNDVNAADRLSGLYEGQRDVNSFNPGGLDFGGQYYWRVDEVNDACVPGVWKGDVWSFRTRAEEGSTFRFTVTGDPRNGLSRWEYLLGQMKAKVGGVGAFHITAGDYYESGAVTEAKDFYEALKAEFGEDVIWYPTVGNHETGTTDMPWLRGYYYDHLEGYVEPGPPNCVETMYSWDYGIAHFVQLNMYFDGTSDESSGAFRDSIYNWLVEDLDKNTQPIVFVIYHEPAYPEGRGEKSSPAGWERFWKLLNDRKVVAGLCAHSHVYARYQVDGDWDTYTWEVDSGNAGRMSHADPYQSFVDITVNNDTGEVIFNTWQGAEGEDYQLADSWTVEPYWRQCAYWAGGDVDGSGYVNAADVVEIINHYGEAARAYPQADLDGSGFIGAEDVVPIVNNYGEGDGMPCP